MEQDEEILSPYSTLHPPTPEPSSDSETVSITDDEFDYISWKNVTLYGKAPK